MSTILDYNFDLLTLLKSRNEILLYCQTCVPLISQK